jgi:hypothetical protein
VLFRLRIAVIFLSILKWSCSTNGEQQSLVAVTVLTRRYAICVRSFVMSVPVSCFRCPCLLAACHTNPCHEIRVHKFASELNQLMLTARSGTRSSSRKETGRNPSSWDRSASIIIRPWRFDSRQGQWIFSCTKPRPVLRPTQPRIQWASGDFSSWMKRPGREADHSVTSSA